MVQRNHHQQTFGLHLLHGGCLDRPFLSCYGFFVVGSRFNMSDLHRHQHSLEQLKSKLRKCKFPMQQLDYEQLCSGSPSQCLQILGFLLCRYTNSLHSSCIYQADMKFANTAYNYLVRSCYLLYLLPSYSTASGIYIYILYIHHYVYKHTLLQHV
eukprot:GHVQ01014256.1.p1 GENE.GHVQ01014256.1~~GHVQ01014256.1.p1  ORF type:complete len:155 (-),score=13.17 GHVQ01014256.1:90-554(-)